MSESNWETLGHLGCLNCFNANISPHLASIMGTQSAQIPCSENFDKFQLQPGQHHFLLQSPNTVLFDNIKDSTQKTFWEHKIIPEIEFRRIPSVQYCVFPPAISNLFAGYPHPFAEYPHPLDTLNLQPDTLSLQPDTLSCFAGYPQLLAGYPQSFAGYPQFQPDTLK